MSKKCMGLIILVLVLGLVQASLAAWDPNTDPALIGWWKFDEGSGSVAKDSSGHGNDGTINGNAQWVEGWRGSALNFDGTDDYVGTGKSLLNNAVDYTMCGWVKSRNSTASRIGLFGQNDLIEMGFNNGNAEIWGATGGTTSTPWAFNNATEWHHIAVVDSGSSVMIYIDGVLANTGGGGTHGTSTYFFNIGGGGIWDATGNWFNGQIDDVRLYSRALKAAEVKSLIPPVVKATKPNPPSGATGVVTPMLTWIHGELSMFENVYVGTSPELTADDLRAPAQPALYQFWYPMPPAPPLVEGQKYYWRVDSLDATKKVIATGDVWNFTLMPLTAWAPAPPDGAKYQSIDTDLSWSAGLNGLSHEVYFGTNEDDVAGGAAGVLISNGAVTLTTMALDPLVPGTTYYWRVDEIDSGGTKTPGPVWSFTTKPVMAKTDNLVGWWKLDDENSGTAVDYSGWDHDGTLMGDPKWVDGAQGGAMEFDGQDDYVDTNYATDLATWTVCAWVTSPQAPAATSPTGPVHREKNFQIDWNHTGDAFRGAAALDIGGTWYSTTFGNLMGGTWYHLAATFDGTALVTYVNGELAATNTAAIGTPDAETATLKFARHAAAAQFFAGTVDDVRLYDKALTADEIKQAMRGDPLLAWDPHPASGSTVDIRGVETLSWSAGETAAQHDVYVGTDRAAVKDADAGAPEYKGRQAGTSYGTAGVVEFGGGTYFWRIDEVEADGATLHKGNIWSFTVPDFLLIDDFESYTNDSPYRVFQTWIDGYGFSADDFFPAGNAGNGSNGVVGHDIWTATSPYYQGKIMETSIVHGGKQSMPFDYNDVVDPFYSETDRTWTTAQDWTAHGVDTLSLWVRGYPVRFVDQGDGAFTISASGSDIWGVADDFRYVYKRLSGDGSITARVESIGNSSGYAKAGVMIRASFDAGSTYVLVVVSPGNGTAFEYRPAANGDAAAGGAWTGAATQAPYWVRLTRTGNAFKAETSPDGTTWTTSGPDQSIVMGSNVYIGLCVTSHNAAMPTTAEFSGTATTGGVTGAWQQVWIGDDPDLTNAAGNLYVAIQDNSNKVFIVNYPDLNGVLATDWTEWQIPLSQFSGANPKAVKKMFIGVGDRNAPAADGSGSLYLDDIRVIKAAPAGQ
jgi:hypothetical protein